jgi:uncharacterized membrane protein YhaH (DUF805 family)
MGTGQLSQNLGTVALVLLALFLAHIATHARRYMTLGREALLCASAYLLVQAVIRSLSTNGLISASSARAITGIAAFCAVAILGQIAWLRRKDTRIRNHKEEPQP